MQLGFIENENNRLAQANHELKLKFQIELYDSPSLSEGSFRFISSQKKLIMERTGLELKTKVMKMRNSLRDMEAELLRELESIKNVTKDEYTVIL